MAIGKFFRTKQNAEEFHIPRSDDHNSGVPGVPGMSPHGDDEGNWLVSYADMMTLLCGFFILLFSMSKLDPPKYEVVKESVAKQFGGEYQVSDVQKTATLLTQVIKEAGVEKEASVRTDTSGVSVVFQSTLFFGTLSADIKAEGKEVLSQFMNGITTRQKLENKKFRIVVEGHTDSRPVLGGTYPSNWELSGARASQVVRMFLDKGFAPDALVAIGYADTRPDQLVSSATDPGKPQPSEAELSKNRRVVIRILDGSSEYIPLPVANVASVTRAPAASEVSTTQPKLSDLADAEARARSLAGTQVQPAIVPSAVPSVVPSTAPSTSPSSAPAPASVAVAAPAASPLPSRVPSPVPSGKPVPAVTAH